jgi:hypothetical protein
MVMVLLFRCKGDKCALVAMLCKLLKERRYMDSTLRTLGSILALGNLRLEKRGPGSRVSGVSEVFRASVD